MNAQVEGPTGGRVFRLRTLGPPALLTESGEPVIAEQTQHRRRLALFAVLAAAGERGRSRDQLLLLFWPDSSQSKARHSLEQLIYSIRNTVAEDVFSGTNPLRINTQRVRSDVAEFTDAVARGDPEAAAAEYGGVFLDGFYLSEAPEFEQWMHAERARLGRQYSSALEQLAHRAATAGDHASATRWWRALSDSDPVNSKAAAGLVRALMENGDYAAALQHADEYERTVTRELGATAGSTMAALAEEVRARASAPPPVSPTVAARQDPGPPEPTSKSPVPAPPAPAATTHVADVATSERGAGRSFLLAKSVLVAALVVLAVVASASVLRRQSRGSPLGDSRPSIAVLPLANVSGAPDDAPIVDGLTEELIGMLSKVDQLRVVARTSAFVFRNSTLDVRHIADSLQVSHVLEGAVQRSNDRMRVQVRLVDARDGSTRWAESYDRELRDILTVQSEIAGAVARELDLRLAGRAAASLRRVSTQNPAAYELYLRGRDPVHFRTPDGRKTGLAYLQQAVALDSTFAAAYANMAYMFLGTQGSRARADFGMRNSEEARRMRWAAEKAIALDPNLPEAYAALGVSHMARGEMQQAEIAFRKALSLPGSSRAREHLARVYLYTGRPRDALRENFLAANEDPLSPTAIADLGRVLCLNGRVSEGMAQLARVADLKPPLRRTFNHTITCHLMGGSWQSVIDSLGHRSADATRAPEYMGYALARSGQTDSARALRAQLIEHSRSEPGHSFAIAVISAALRDHDDAVVWLDRAFDDSSFTHEIMLPLFSELHAYRGFERIRRRLGIQNR